VILVNEQIAGFSMSRPLLRAIFQRCPLTRKPPFAAKNYQFSIGSSKSCQPGFRFHLTDKPFMVHALDKSINQGDKQNG
jgi:hypothetical protein